jgi:hypothetical protein
VDGMAVNRRANATLFGFDFQVNAAIVLMIENIKSLKNLKLEGNYEDIELELENNQYILAQAKSVENSSSDFHNVRKNLKKALISLSEGSQEIDVQQLILITNSPDPLNDKYTRSIFYGEAHRSFSSLPESSKKLIEGYLKELDKPLDTNKFTIQVLPFETDNDLERYKVVRKNVDDFIGELKLNIPGLGKELLSIWNEEVFKNGSKKDSAIKLSKKDIIWPVIVIVTNDERCDESLLDEFEIGQYEEILRQYKETIDNCCEKCEIFIKVLSDYNEYKSTKKTSEKYLDFISNKWGNYKSEFENVGIDADVLEGLTKIILYRIIKNRINIDRIKKGVGLV